MDTDPILIEEIDIDDVRERFNLAVAAIWTIVEDLGLEAEDISEAINKIESELDNADL